MSVSLLEGGSVPLDLPAKYQKLASEYAKIRAQFGVLKKAVVDEQNQSAELKEILRTKEQNLRKAEQELDSLNFRNQQLTKRVTILQEELDSTQKTSKVKSKGTTKEPKDSVLVEELQQKITENANLVTTLQEQTELYETEKFRLNQKIEVCEHKIREYQSNLSTIENTKLAKYESETKQLVSRLNAKDDEISKLQREVRDLKQDLIGKSAALDTATLREKFSKLIESLSLHELLSGLNGFFQQMEFRYADKGTDGGLRFQRLVEVNQRNRLMLQDLSDKYLLNCSLDGGDQDFPVGLESLCESLDGYASVLGELSESLDCCSTDADTVNTFKQFIGKVQKFWTQFSSDLKALHSPNLSSADTDELVGNIPDIFRSLRATCDYFLSEFNEKFKSRPIHRDSEKEILVILSSLSQKCSTVYRALVDNVSVLVQILETRIFRIKQKAALLQSERCCENWKREIESLKAAHAKKIKDLEEQISCLSEATTPRSTNSGNVVQSPTEVNPQMKSDDGNDFESMTPFDSPEVRQEAEYLKFYNARANKLVADRQLAESKVTVLMEECESLQRRLAHSLENRLLLEDSLKQAESKASRLQEELQTTTLNYEIQLQSMSEHMANMSEKLASQQEEIEFLKHELTERASARKGKSN